MFKKLKEYNLENITGGIVASFCALNNSGTIQLIYCLLAVLSFILTFKFTIEKNKEQLREQKLKNDLLQLEIEKQSKRANYEKVED